MTHLLAHYGLNGCVRGIGVEPHMRTEDSKPKKTVSLSLRVLPQTKAALLAIGDAERRSMANTVEWLVPEYQKKNGSAKPNKNKENA